MPWLLCKCLIPDYKQTIQTIKIYLLNIQQTASYITIIIQIIYLLCFIITTIHYSILFKFFLRCIFGTGGCKITQQNRTNCKLCRYQVVKIYKPGQNRQGRKGPNPYFLKLQLAKSHTYAEDFWSMIVHTSIFKYCQK